ncbi:ChlI component of cobalt chelatase [Cutibacterium acnes JCM 18918]|nr:ChlI component of cobalt chelatase [Cutibacterium acnes JCM 18918]
MAVGADTVHPQLLDRFGLCAVTVPCRNPKDRELIVNHRLTFDDGPDSFITTCTDATNEAVNRICAARNKLPDLEWTDAARNKFTELLTQAHAPGQRADLVLARSATAYAAWRGDNNVVVEDVTAVAELVLRHRRRNLSSSQAPSPDLNDAHSHSGPSSPHDGNEQPDEKKATTTARQLPRGSSPLRKPLTYSHPPPQHMTELNVGPGDAEWSPDLQIFGAM